MSGRNMVLFVTGIAVVGITPLIILATWLARGRRDKAVPTATGGASAVTEPPAPAMSGVKALAILLTTVAVLALAGAWYVATNDGPGASGMGSMGAGTAGAGGPVAQGASSAPVDILPAKLAGLALTQRVTGSAAVQDVEALHQTQFPITGAEIAQYAGRSGKAMVWVSYTSDAATATSMVAEMQQKIAGGGSPFDTPQQVAGNTGVWETHGMGQVHYFMARGNGVWWISADTKIGADALSQILRAAA